MSSEQMDPKYTPGPAAEPTQSAPEAPETAARAALDTTEAPAGNDAQADSWEALEREYNGTLEEIFDEYLKAPEPTGTGIREVDAALNGGLRAGVSVLGGEPGAGKSAYALQIAFRHAFAGKRAMYISLEMSRGQCLYRICSHLSTLPQRPKSGVAQFAWADADKYVNAANAKLEEADSEESTAAIMRELTHGGNAYMTAARVFKERYSSGLVIATGTKLRELPTMLKLIKRAAGLGASLVVVDYLQLIEGTGVMTEYDRVTAISQTLSELGHKLKIPILAISALNRAGATDTKDEMHNFKGSGYIEYDGECAMTLRQDGDATYTDGTRPVLLKVAKNRHGPFVNLPPVKLIFDGAHNVFEAK